MSGDLLETADRLWRGDIGIEERFPFAAGGEHVEVADRTLFMASFANVSAFDTDDGLVLVDTGAVFVASSVHGVIRNWSERAAPYRDLLPRSHRPRLRRPGVRGGSPREELADAARGRARGDAGTLRPLHPHRRLQRLDQSPAVRRRRARSGRPSTATPTRPTATRSRSTSAASASSSITPAARPTTTPGHGCPAGRCCAPATS